MRALPISHRGVWWPDPRQQNTVEAFHAAAQADHGLEIDVRVRYWGTKVLSPRGVLIVAHGPEDVSYRVDRLLPALAKASRIFWNIKEVAAVPLLAEFLDTHSAPDVGLRQKSVLFDWDFCGDATQNSLLATGVPILLRASDKPEESLLSVLHNSLGVGVWLDAFERDWVTAAVIEQVHAAGKAAYVVSPELHDRPLTLAVWDQWREADGICTDFPGLLKSFLSVESPLFPENPWWN